jgi:hypothetical protein
VSDGGTVTPGGDGGGGFTPTDAGGTVCAQYGQVCAANGDCCAGLQCINGRCGVIIR